VLQNFKFVSFFKVIIYVYRYRAIVIHCIDWLSVSASIVPSSHSYRYTSTPSYQFWFYNCSRNISLLCLNTFKVIISIIKASNSISNIISYRVAQQLRTPLEILCFEYCCLSGILSTRIFQIQELSFQSCDHSTCQKPDSSHWWSVNNLGCKEMKRKQVTFCNKDHFNLELTMQA